MSVNLGGDISYLDPSNPSKPKRVLKGHNKFITALSHDRKTNTLYTASYDAIVIGWDVATGNTSSFSGKGHTNQVNRLKLQGTKVRVSLSAYDSYRRKHRFCCS